MIPQEVLNAREDREIEEYKREILGKDDPEENGDEEDEEEAENDDVDEEEEEVLGANKEEKTQDCKL